jgi:hypothetical protein
MEAVLPFGVAGESCCGLGLRRTGHLGSPENSRWLNKINKINPGKKKKTEMDAVLPFGVAGESCSGLGLRGTGHLGSPENCRWFGSAFRPGWVAGELSLE